MGDAVRKNPRLVAVALLAGLILVGLIIATGGGLSSPNTSTNAPPPPPVAQTTAAPHVPVKAALTTHVQHVGGHTWKFTYIVRVTGTSPVAGFQINAPRANLFRVRSSPKWGNYGAGVCGGTYPGVLVYWSTNALASNIIQSKHIGKFSFLANTSGPTRVGYSLSFGASAPLFGKTEGPSPSALKAGGPCRG